MIEQFVVHQAMPIMQLVIGVLVIVGFAILVALGAKMLFGKN